MLRFRCPEWFNSICKGRGFTFPYRSCTMIIVRNVLHKEPFTVVESCRKARSFPISVDIHS